MGVISMVRFHLFLYSKITPGVTLGSICGPSVELRSTTCNAIALPTVLPLQPLFVFEKAKLMFMEPEAHMGCLAKVTPRFRKSTFYSFWLSQKANG